MRRYNQKILAYSTDQILPFPRPFGGRWFDDATVPAEIIEAVRTSPAELTAGTYSEIP
jgi:clorobiocin biosynthesis protein CloN6